MKTLPKYPPEVRVGTNDNRQMIEEPCDAKVSSTVLKPSGGSDPVA
jgi:hypothetical protein